MTHTDLGIDEATFAASLRVIGHPWRAGQRCTEHNHSCGQSHVFACRIQCSHGEYRQHDIPISAVTDELLMRMLDLLISTNGCELDYGRPGVRIITKDDIIIAPTLRAAIIRATAALKEEKS